jgi:catechol 2,3-dioxygenase-like lactoylglutathione lyase family enzyme
VLFDHVTIRVGDRAVSEPLYARLLGVLGFEQTDSGTWAEWGDFSLAEATEAKPPTQGLHIGFRAPSREAVDEFWRAGVAAGLEDDGEPGPRPQYREDYYGGFLRDPDGNSIEAVHHGGMPEDGLVDHVWLRVADVERSLAFYGLVGRFARYEAEPRPDRRHVHFHPAGRGSFSTVAGTPTREAHLAFPAPDTATVDAFHAALVEAGYRDNGGPGPRPEYSAGYYGAFVLDPDGNNIELVTRTEPSPGG